MKLLREFEIGHAYRFDYSATVEEKDSEDWILVQITKRGFNVLQQYYIKEAKNILDYFQQQTTDVQAVRGFQKALKIAERHGLWFQVIRVLRGAS